MIKTLAVANKSERERFKVPKSVQQSIPIQRIFRDGIWQSGNKFTQTWRFADINYSLASHDDQEDMFRSYCAVLNSLPTDATTKITINNRRLNGADFRRSVLMRERGDGLDQYRREYNAVLTEKAAASNNLIQDKYITVSVVRKSVEEARTFFHRVDADLSKNLGKLDSGARALDNQERLRIFHDFFRPGDEQYFQFDLGTAMRRGHHFKDYIAPDGMCFKADHFEMGGKVGRVLFLREYASYIKDSMITDLSDFSRSLMLSIDILPIPTDEAVKEMQTRIMGIESDITRWQQKQNTNNNFTATIPYDLEQLRSEAKEFLDDLSTRDQRMVFANVTLVHMADTLEQLDADTETLCSIGRKALCQFAVLRYQQEDGLNTALPYGLRRIKTTRTLTTESAAVLMPFRVQEIQDAGGIYYGVNAVSKNLLICNRKKLLNPHGFILGVSGSGKSFSMKEAITFIALSTEDDIIVIDAEREYSDLIRALGGAVIEISPSSNHHINPLEIARGYGVGENPVAMKSELLMSICEQQMGVGQLGAFHKSIIDRCTANVYHDFVKSGGKASQPVLADWRNEVKRQPEREAEELALASELFVEGSLNMFAHETNADISNRIVSFDLYEMGEQLKPTALNVTMETIQNRVAANRLAGKYTWVFIDEIYLFFKYYYSAQFLYKCWKRFRKFDILLVFMFDRLGRKDDETPFVVEWFVKNGIEVWSAMEGQQRFDNHVDKLLNYIRYWQASGESIKTSIRVKTRMEQLTQEGHYTGGGVPYGYRLEQQGRINKRNRSVFDLTVDEAEAEIVKLIFEKYVVEGYGAQRLCKYLVEQGVMGRKGSNIPTTSINRMIKNRIYTGVICNGECKSEVIPELQIVDEDMFQRAQEIMRKRTTHHDDVPLNTRGQSLLVGNVFCGHCGGRLTLTTSGRKRIRKDGTLHRETRARYQCHYNVRHPGECDGQSGYGVTKLDNLVDKIVRMQFERIKNEPPQDLIERQNAKEIDLAEAKLKLAHEQLSQKRAEYETLRAETVKVLQGKSRLNVDLLNSLVAETEETIKELEAQVQTAQAELQERLDSANIVRQEYAQLISWADMYDHCTFEAKKMILAQFIKAVYVRRDYEIEIEFNVSFEEFQNLYLAKEVTA